MYDKVQEVIIYDITEGFDFYNKKDLFVAKIKHNEKTTIIWNALKKFTKNYLISKEA